MLRLFITGLISLAFVSAQEPAVIRKSPTVYTVDASGNVFLVTASNDLEKYSSSGKLMSIQGFRDQPAITSIDVSNPFEPYLFLRDRLKVIYLDNQLAYRGETDLSVNGSMQPAVAGRSYDNNIWIFDMADMQLKKLDREGKLLASSGNMLALGGKQLHPVSVHDDGQFVYLNVPDKGIYKFDVFANFIWDLPFQDVSMMHVDENGITGSWEDSVVLRIDPVKYTFEILADLNKSRDAMVNISGSKIYRNYGDSLVISTYP